MLVTQQHTVGNHSFKQCPDAVFQLAQIKRGKNRPDWPFTIKYTPVECVCVRAWMCVCERRHSKWNIINSLQMSDLRNYRAFEECRVPVIIIYYYNSLAGLALSAMFSHSLHSFNCGRTTTVCTASNHFNIHFRSLCNLCQTKATMTTTATTTQL